MCGVGRGFDWLNPVGTEIVIHRYLPYELYRGMRTRGELNGCFVARDGYRSIHRRFSSWFHPPLIASPGAFLLLLLHSRVVVDNTGSVCTWNAFK